MQPQPEKTVGNYNELTTNRPPIALPRGVIDLVADTRPSAEQHDVVSTGIELVNAKIVEILGEDNLLTKEGGVATTVRFVDTDPDHPDAAGYFMRDKNTLTVIGDKTDHHPEAPLKVFIHEYFHYLSHNGRDDSERLTDASPLTRNNNIGFSRAGLDMREGKEGTITGDYFKAFNEAVTEQLSIEIFPGVHETYSEYRDLLGQVIDDAVTNKLGSYDTDKQFQPWSHDQIKNYIYQCFFKGDLSGFTNLLQNIYREYDISEQAFGLMTNREDLPSLVKRKLHYADPGGPPPSPSQVAALVRVRLNNKKPSDYETDVIDRDPSDGDDPTMKYGQEYDDFIAEANIVETSAISRVNSFDTYRLDTNGLVVYRGETAKLLLAQVTKQLDQLVTSNTDAATINSAIDDLLFKTYRMSMLSDDFRDFYIYKHTTLGE